MKKISSAVGVLLLINAVLAALLAWWWLTPPPTASWKVWQPPPAQPFDAASLSVGLIELDGAAHDVGREARRRPIFEPTRQVITAASAASDAAPQDDLDQAQPLGIVAGAKLSAVMLQTPGGTKIVRTGEKIGDWTLSEIDDRRLIFSRAGRKKTLDLPMLKNVAEQSDAGKAAAAAAAAGQRRR